MKNKSFCLFPNCVPVKGIKRSVIYDLQRGSFDFIPNVMYEMLIKFNKKTINDVIYHYGSKNKNYIEEYFNFLIKKEYIFYSETPELFPNINFKNYDDNCKIISNSIIDFDENSNHNLLIIYNQLSDLFCESVQLRFFYIITLKELNKILINTKDSTFRSIYLIIQFSPLFNINNIKKFLIENKRVKQIIINNSPFNKTINLFIYGTTIIWTKSKFKSEKQCGYISPSYFICNLKYFIESKNYNNCLYKKVSIDKKGFIKNCPAFIKSYGNIKNTTLEEAINKRGFKDFWYINKDMIDVCKDCEFRYMCPDCRAFIKDDKNIYSKPSRCNYDPYNAKWKNILYVIILFCFFIFNSCDTIKYFPAINETHCEYYSCFLDSNNRIFLKLPGDYILNKKIKYEDKKIIKQILNNIGLPNDKILFFGETTLSPFFKIFLINTGNIEYSTTRTSGVIYSNRNHSNKSVITYQCKFIKLKMKSILLIGYLKQKQFNQSLKNEINNIIKISSY